MHGWGLDEGSVVSIDPGEPEPAGRAAVMVEAATVTHTATCRSKTKAETPTLASSLRKLISTDG